MGAAAARDRYVNDPDTDIHAYTSELTGGIITRQDGKTTNFMTIYGAGPEAIALQIKKPLSETKKLLALYNEKMPFISRLSEACKIAAHREGFFTLLNRARRHFNLWAPGGQYEEGAGPCAREEAEQRVCDPKHPWYGRRLWRAETYKALNVLIQSSAAIQTKEWMRACYREGVIPMLQMHDSLDLSVSSPEIPEMVARLGVGIIKLDVPMKVDVNYGRTWGDAKHTWAELHAETSHRVEPVPVPIAPEAPKFVNNFDDEPDSEPAEDIVLAVLNEVSAAERPPWEGTPAFAATASVNVDPPIPRPPPESPSKLSPPPSSSLPSGENGRDGGDGFDDFPRYNGPLGKILCPFHDEKTPSCHLYADGHYHCFGCSAHGWIDEDIGDIGENAIAQTNPAPSTDTLESALKLWDASNPITSTLAERYLTDTRKLDLAALPNGTDAVLRFHPRCPFGGNGARHPCLLALFRDVESDAPAGIHRIGLTADAKKIRRLTLGRWPGPRAIKLWPVTHKLTIGEGIETVLGAVRCGAITPPAWAMGPKTNIAGFPVLPGVKAITVLVDRGDPAALAGAEACVARYVAAGVPARWLRTVRVKDFNDLVL